MEIQKDSFFQNKPLAILIIALLGLFFIMAIIPQGFWARLSMTIFK